MTLALKKSLSNEVGREEFLRDAENTEKKTNKREEKYRYLRLETKGKKWVAFFELVSVTAL